MNDKTRYHAITFMKVLVTGSNGFLGSAFLDFLKKKDISYTIYNRNHPESTPTNFDSVVNFGGLTPNSEIKSGNISPDKYFYANVKGTKLLLDTVRRNKNIKRFINIGSSAEYGFSVKPITEDLKEKPRGPYGKTKLEQSRLVERFSEKNKVKTINLRLFNVVGLPSRSRLREETVKNPSVFESLFYQFTKNFKGTIIINNKNSIRDYIDIEDVMEAILAALKTKKGKSYEIINICSGKGDKLIDVVKLFGDILNKKYKIAVNKDAKADFSIGSPKKAEKILGWKSRISLAESIKNIIGPRRKLIIVGAGVAGQEVVEQIRIDNRQNIDIVGFVDDDKNKQNLEISGVRVMGRIDDLTRLMKSKNANQVLISIPSLGGNLVKRVTKLIPPGAHVEILPTIVIRGKVDLSLVREIDPSDLIGRPLVKSDQQFISEKACGKTFLVTGGAGSIGSEIVRQLYYSKAESIIVIDSWEEGVFNLLEELEPRHNHLSSNKIRAFIGNIRDKKRLEEIASLFKIDIILHAAAYKHVPLMEDNPDEAYKTNYIGTKNLLDLALKYNIKDFVLISTDKAVNPVSVMGKTKRQAELLVKEYAKKYPNYRFCAVRFGNVLNSSGSVVPIFIKQIKSRSPITITHKDMTRYFMSIPEAVSLVILSWVLSKNGQILILDMGEPVKIMDLAINLIRFYGMEPHKDIIIKEIGIRPGEKIHEELAYDKSKLRKGPTERIFIAEEI